MKEIGYMRLEGNETSKRENKELIIEPWGPAVLQAEEEEPASNLALWEVSFSRCLGQESSWNGSEWPQCGVTASTWGLFGLA